MTRTLLTQGPGRENRHATAASLPTLATQLRCSNVSRYRVLLPGDGETFTIAVKCRVAWALQTLHERHGDDCPGHHGRYVLRCDVRRAGA